MANTDPTVLAFDCAISGRSVAVMAGDRLLSSLDRPQGERERGDRDGLLPDVLTTLDQAGCGFGDLDRLAVTVGPGSFTGLRIGLACARGIMLATGLPCVALTTLEVLAAQALLTAGDVGPGGSGGSGGSVGAGTILAAIDSRRGDLFVQPFDRAGHPTGPAEAIAPERWSNLWPRCVPPITIVGDGGPALSAHFPVGSDVSVPSGAMRPMAEVVARLATTRDPQHAPPHALYLRRPDAVPMEGRGP